MEMLDSTGGLIEFPEVPEGYGMYVDILMDIGPIQSNGMGTSPITDQHLYYWQYNMEQKLAPWECRLIKKMSQAFLHYYEKGKTPNTIAPYYNVSDEEIVAQRRDATVNQIHSIFGGKAK